MTRAKALVDRGVATLLAVLMAVAVVNVVWQVASRFLLGSPSAFTDEAARYLLVWIGLVGAAHAAGRKLHIAVDLVPARWEPRLAVPLAWGVHVALLVFALLVMTLGGARLVWLSFELGQTTAALGISLGWVYLVVPATGLVIGFHAVLGLLETGRARDGSGKA